MNETLNKALIAIINGATAATNTAIDFLSREIPLVIQELLLYKFVWHLTWFSLGLVGSLLSIYFGIKMVKKAVEVHTPYGDAEVPFVLGAGLSLVVQFGACLMIAKNMNWLQIWLAPRIYLIEYAAELYKGMPK